MKTRVISAIAALALLFSALAFYDTLYANFVAFLMLLLMIYEIHKAFKVPFWYVSLIPAAMVCFLDTKLMFSFGIYIAILYLIVFAILIIISKKHILFANTAAVLLECLLIIFGFGTCLLIREQFSVGDFYGDSLAITIFAMALGWLCDTFAFLFGRAIGKRKLSPEISPKKTVEGAIGGVVATVIFSVIYFAVYATFGDSRSMFGEIPILGYFVIALIGFLGAIAGIFGDLFASYIKRECKIKDFGNIMPGHGGALDRIDSVLFTIPLTYVCVLFLQTIVV